MTDIEFNVSANVEDGLDSPRELSIRAGNVIFTRLFREPSSTEFESVKVPLTRLAFWLLDHWWRLRWESIPPGGVNPDWREAHELASIGGGFTWPRTTIWGEGTRVGLISRSDPQGVMGPVRFLTDALVFVNAQDYEAAVDRFLNIILQNGSFSDRDSLVGMFSAVKSERQDHELASWRRIEAMAGFDPDEAPDSLMDALSLLETKYCTPDIEEVVSAAPGPGAAATLAAILEETAQSAFSDADFGEAARIGARELRSGVAEPWELAEAAADMIRNQVSATSRPLRNKRLADLTGISDAFLKSRSLTQGRDIPYGLRLKKPTLGHEQVLLRSRWGQGRRFELARCLGDAIWSSASLLGPISRSSTARQKFQRAFAASLLCPASALISFLGTDRPTDSDISEAVTHFHVSESVVRSVLVNKHVLDRRRLGLPMSDLRDDRPIEELAEAA
jgi:hypothetical protein